MHQLNNYVALLLLVFIFPVVEPQIRNLSPLRGYLNTDLPDYFKTKTTTTANYWSLRSASTDSNDVEEMVDDALESAFEQMEELLGDTCDKPTSTCSLFPGHTDSCTSQTASTDGGCVGLPPMTIEAPSASLSTFRRATTASVNNSLCVGQPMLAASMMLSCKWGMEPYQALRDMPNIEVNSDRYLEERKKYLPNCPDYIEPTSTLECNTTAPYRTLNGSCNNIDNPEWGLSMRRFNRYLQPVYEDGIQKMRGEGRELELPSARTVSAGLQGITQKPPREDLTLLVMQWGQFIDHDLTHTAEAENSNGDISCCEGGDPCRSSDNPDCRPINVSKDPLFSADGQQCMHFVRSIVASKGCSLGPREQQNQLTSYLDASNVYGSDEEEASDLRLEFSGFLDYSNNPSYGHGTFLPRTNCPNSTEKTCFSAGDVRVNEQPALTSMHTLWLRVHNNIAEELASLNPYWDDEMLYQETRRIVAALHQQITYGEFLPIVLGPDSIEYNQLNLRTTGYDNSYDPEVDATITNVFATAAFRFGHTLVAESFKGMMDRYVPLFGNFDVPVVLNNPSTGPTALLQGLTGCPNRGVDAFVTPTLVNHLFATGRDNITDQRELSMDLVSLNIQRGRDHGIPPYHEWRRACKLSPINSWKDLFHIMDPEAVFVFKNSYMRVEDIDLFPALLAENTVPLGLLGPTFLCIIGQQFRDIKIGDRFWYENQNQPKPFTLGQLSALREQSFASIMCQHLELDRLQPMVFMSESQKWNQRRDCSEFPRLDLRFWLQHPSNPTNPTDPDIHQNPIQTSFQHNGSQGQWCIIHGFPASYLDRFFPKCSPNLFVKDNEQFSSSGTTNNGHPKDTA